MVAIGNKLMRSCDCHMQDSTQQTMLTTWLIELFLNDLGVLKDEGDKEGYKHLQKEFHKFLQQPQLGVSYHSN